MLLEEVIDRLNLIDELSKRIENLEEIIGDAQAKNFTPDGAMDIKQAAKYCGVGRRKIKEWVDEGLTHTRYGESENAPYIFERKDLDDWKAKYKRGVKPYMRAVH